MARHVLVTGATGTLGRRVVPAAVAAGHRVHALSRRDRVSDTPDVRWHRGDLLAGAGIDAAVDGVDAIVHCATQGTRDKDVASMQNLITAARRAGVGHVIYMSIVGIDRIPLPYYRTKLRGEQALESSGLGHTVLRATQFHDLIDTTFSIQRCSPVLWALRDVRFQPIDTATLRRGSSSWSARHRPAGRRISVGPRRTLTRSWPGCSSQARGSASHGGATAAAGPHRRRIPDGGQPRAAERDRHRRLTPTT